MQMYICFKKKILPSLFKYAILVSTLITLDLSFGLSFFSSVSDSLSSVLQKPEVVIVL